ncbi:MULTISPECIES: hypothetical protein [Paraburkholderia]|uniref:MARCKS-like protein n=1 Tax=Paraburkholderia acidicola TaxID=1912599 RepID=A0ABV1M1P9_9BURK
MKNIAPESHESPGESDKNRTSRTGHDSHVSPHDTAQAVHDEEEKKKHPASEGELDSSQDKNPVPRGTTRK